MTAPCASGPTTITVEGTLVSQPYIAMTLAIMGAFGVEIGNRGFRRFQIEPQPYDAQRYSIEPDASAASYFFAAAALLGTEVTIDGLGAESLQGDLNFVDLLEHMGCSVTRSAKATTVRGCSELQGLDVDMNAISDTVMTMAVLALFARGTTRIRNVGHIRHKETDRLSALAIELRKLGATVDELPDGLVIFPPDRLVPARVATYNDHRMGMAFAIAGLKLSNLVIEDPKCTGKTYPEFWSDWAKAWRVRYREWNPKTT